MTSRAVQKVNIALGAPPYSDLYTNVKKVSTRTILGEDNVEIVNNGNVSEIIVSPVLLTSLSPGLSITKVFYPNSTTVMEYLLELVGNSGDIVQGIPKNITISTVGNATSLSAASVTVGSDLVVSPVMNGNTISSYLVSLGPDVATSILSGVLSGTINNNVLTLNSSNLVRAGAGINVVQNVDGSYTVSAAVNNTSITLPNSLISLASDAITGNGGIDVVINSDDTFTVKPMANLITANPGVVVTTSGSGFVVGANVDGTTVTTNGSGQLVGVVSVVGSGGITSTNTSANNFSVAANSTLISGSNGITSTFGTGTFALGANVDTTSIALVSNKLALASTAIQAGTAISAAQNASNEFTLGVEIDGTTITTNGSGQLTATAGLGTTVSGTTGVTVTGSPTAGYVVAAKVDGTSIAAAAGGPITLSSTAIAGTSGISATQNANNEFTIGAKVDSSNMIIDTAGNIVLGPNAITSANGSGITTSYNSTTGQETISTNITTTNLSLVPSGSNTSLGISVPISTAILVEGDGTYLTQHATVALGMTSYSLSLAQGSNFIKGGSGIGVTTSGGSFTISTTISSYYPNNVLYVDGSWTGTNPLIFTTVSAAIAYANATTTSWQIIVYPGTYSEANLDMNTNTAGCSIFGFDPNVTILNVTSAQTLENLTSISGISINGSFAITVLSVSNMENVIINTSSVTVYSGITVKNCSLTTTFSATGTPIYLINTSLKFTGASSSQAAVLYIMNCSLSASSSLTFTLVGFVNILSSYINPNINFAWGVATGSSSACTGCIWDTPIQSGQLTSTNSSSWCDRSNVTGTQAAVTGTNTVTYSVPYNPSATGFTWFVVSGVTPQSISTISTTGFTYIAVLAETINYTVALPQITPSSLISL